MAFTARTRLVNPRLGTYFGIFAAAFVSLVLMALMFEQLGTADAAVRLLMFAGPIVFFVAIGLLSASRQVGDYFVSGRRVPAFFNGLVLAISALGGAGFLALTGSLFSIGFDALCLSLGFAAGFVFMGLLLAPYLRKAGAYTVPTYLGRRLESQTLRIVAAAVLAVPLLLLLAAEARFAAYAAAWLTGQPEGVMALVVVGCAAAAVVAGGMRSLTWSSSAKAIAVLFALAVPATVTAIIMSNLPLPQMTHGNILRVLTRTEGARGLPIFFAPVLAADFPGQGLEPLAKRFIQAFGSVGSLAFTLMTLVTAAGVAASPSLLMRPGTTPGVYETRKSFGWAVLVGGVVLLTLPAVAVFLRALFLDQVIGQPVDRLPSWFQALQQVGIVQVDTSTPTVGFSSVRFQRDAALFALPYAAGFPQVLVYLALAGALAAALAALAAALMATAAILSEDIIRGLQPETAPDGARITTARVCLMGAAFVTAWLTVAAPGDPLKLFLWALNFSASAIFPVLVLSVWWKRINAWGAMAGMLAGLAVTALAILMGETEAWALPGTLAAAVGLPAGTAAALAGSLLTPVPGKSILDGMNEMRVPGGETLYDREVRLQRLKSLAAGRDPQVSS
jgi:cation/acetate symporter